MAATFTITDLREFLRKKKEAQQAPPINVNVDLSGIAKLLASGLKIKGGITQVPS